MESKGKLSQVKRGLRRTAFWLLGMAWLGMVFGGMAIAFTSSPHSPIIGWVLLAVAAVILIATMDKWVGVFSALLACAIINCVIVIAKGHMPNSPAVRVARLDAVIMTFMYLAGAMASFTFTKRKLHLLDRLALFVFVFCFFWGAVAPRLMVLTLGIGVGWLVAAWAYDRLQRRRNPQHQSGPALEGFRGNTAR
jgi:hypothetical protein